MTEGVDWEASDGDAEPARVKSLSSLKSQGFSAEGLQSTSVGPFSVAPRVPGVEGCCGDCLLKSEAIE